MRIFKVESNEYVRGNTTEEQTLYEVIDGNIHSDVLFTITSITYNHVSATYEDPAYCDEDVDYCFEWDNYGEVPSKEQMEIIQNKILSLTD